MNDLVVLSGNMILTDSQIVAKAFDMKHAYLMRIVDSVLEDYPDLRVISNHSSQDTEYVRFIDREYRGVSFKAVEMNKEFFSLLMMRLTTHRARQLQRSFNRAFHAMEKQLAKHADKLEWKAARLQGVKQRKDLTDVIKQFVEYATSQGSKSAARYYASITLMEYGALELLDKSNKVPDNFRDSLNISEVSALMGAEDVARRAIAEGMRQELHYKDVYTYAKQAVTKFSEDFRLPRLTEK